MNSIQSFSSMGSISSATSGLVPSSEASSEFESLLQDSMSSTEANQVDKKTVQQNEPSEDKKDKPEEADARSSNPDNLSSNPDNLLSLLLGAPLATLTPSQPGASVQTDDLQALGQASASRLSTMSEGLTAQLKSLDMAAKGASSGFSDEFNALTAEAMPLDTASLTSQALGSEALTASSTGTAPATVHIRPLDVAAASPADPIRHVATPYGQEGWDKAVSQRVTWMVQDQLKSASLTLNPPHMGPIQVQIQVENQQVQVQFVSALPEVRQALQDAIPALQEMLNQSGLQLSQSDVSDQQPPPKQQSARSQTNSDDNTATDSETTAQPIVLTTRSTGSGLLNTFA